MFIKYNANPTGKSTGDCVIRAIATATDKSWLEIYDDLYEYGRASFDMMDTNEIWHKYLYDIGFDIFAITVPCMTVKEFTRVYRYGTYLLGTGRHVLAVIDGDYLDAWDSGNEIPVFYWKKGD